MPAAGHRVVFIGGANELQLKPDGEIFKPGATIVISDLQRASLTASGHRFGAVPDPPEPDPVPDPPPPLEPAEVSATVMPPKTATVAPVRAATSTPKGE